MQGQNPTDLSGEKTGTMHNLILRVKLIMRLMADPRVSLPVKLIPAGALLYLLAFPDLAPGPVDDGAVIWLGSYLFVQLCPPGVVQEHLEALQGSMGATPADENVVEGEFREKR